MTTFSLYSGLYYFPITFTSINSLIYFGKSVQPAKGANKRIPWKTDYQPYLEHDFFFIKYENLLASPEEECKRILGYLGLLRHNDQIRQAIERQSFKKKKERFLEREEFEQARFLREGKSGQWEKMLSGKQKKLFREILSDSFKQLDYPLDSSI